VRRKDFLASLFLPALLLTLSTSAQSQTEFSTGLQVGFARLESDIRSPKLSPYLSGTLRVSPTPFFSVGGLLGFSPLKQSDRPNLKSTIVPFEIDGRVEFLPFATVSPFGFVGAGGVYWRATEGGKVVVLNGSKQRGLDSFLKTGGGLRFRLNETLGLEVGGVFRYSLTDALDQRFSGDEKDQVFAGFIGLSYRFRSSRNDRDRDGVPDDLDLAVEVPEDADGYLDHDGVPEEGPALQPALLPLLPRNGESNNDEQVPPVVIHHPRHRAEAGRALKLSAAIYSSVPLRKASLVYRRFGEKKWSVVELKRLAGDRYQGVVPSSAVTLPALEYAIIALGQDLNSVGYAGLPRRPNRVKVFPGGRMWRYIGGALSALGWGTATYIVLRKQQ